MFVCVSMVVCAFACFSWMTEKTLMKLSEVQICFTKFGLIMTWMSENVHTAHLQPQ